MATKKTAKKTTKKTAKKTTKRKTPKRNPTKAAKARKTTKAKKKTAKKTTKRKAPKRNPAKAAKARKTTKKPTNAKRRKNPKRDPVGFKIGGRQPDPATVRATAKDVETILRTYQPVKVTSSKAFYPWLVRRGEKLGISATMMLHAVCDLAERGRVDLYTDEDHVPSLATADAKLLPRMGDTGEPLMWVVVR